MTESHSSPANVTAPPSDLAARIERYLEDAPSNGGHSDAAGANCWELLDEAVEALRGSAKQPSPETEISDDDWQRALNCAHSVMESYNAKLHISTEEGRKRALDDAMQHAFGLLSLRDLIHAQPTSTRDSLKEVLRRHEWKYAYISGKHDLIDAIVAALPLTPAQRALPDQLELAQFLCSEVAAEPWDELSQPKYLADADIILAFLSHSSTERDFSKGGIDET